jgi:hypothetical protein
VNAARWPRRSGSTPMLIDDRLAGGCSRVGQAANRDGPGPHWAARRWAWQGQRAAAAQSATLSQHDRRRAREASGVRRKAGMGTSMTYQRAPDGWLSWMSDGAGADGRRAGRPASAATQVQGTRRDANADGVGDAHAQPPGTAVGWLGLPTVNSLATLLTLTLLPLGKRGVDRDIRGHADRCIWVPSAPYKCHRPCHCLRRSPADVEAPHGALNR